jgi:coenzyme F420-reducing hydrogenase delta subunit/quinol-cytochrome oxidoreductase complex cytochrome b subunit
VLAPIQALLRNIFFYVEGWIDSWAGPDSNPLYHLGAFCWFFFWIVAVTGLYLFIPFETSVVGAWQSIEHMTNEQWFFSGVMRSLHRYASDGMVAVTMIHLIREFAFGRYYGSRWFAWFTGVPLIWLLLSSGITGYWLVWDMLAQYLAIGTVEWIDWFGIFGQSVARNFLTRGSMTDRFFTLLIFMHIFVPLFLLFVMWIHIMRINRPNVNPPKELAIGSMIMMVVLSLVYPATSHPISDLGMMPETVRMDWFYLMFYPMYDSFGAGPTWTIAAGFTLLVGVVPWLRFSKRNPAAVVTLDKCNGCTRCYNDCPFGAITMVPRTDGKPYKVEAQVNPDLCSGCGMCTAACPPSSPYRNEAILITGIDRPDLPLTKLKERTVAAMASLKGPSRVLVFGCDHALHVDDLVAEGVAGVSMPCSAMLPPSFIDYVLSSGLADGVFITGCRHGDCHHRLGPMWFEQRLRGERDPYLRERVERERIRVVWAAPTEKKDIEKEMAKFRADLEKLGKSASPAVTASVLETEELSVGV